MTQLHVVRVFLGPGGTAGNLLGVFLDGAAIPPERCLIVTAELGSYESPSSQIIPSEAGQASAAA